MTGWLRRGETGTRKRSGMRWACKCRAAVACRQVPGKGVTIVRIEAPAVCSIQDPGHTHMGMAEAL